MVAYAGGYYRAEFQGFRGVTQGDPLYPTISHVVVDSVERHWAAVLEESKGGQEGHRREGQHRGYFVYSDDGMLASTELEWLQGAFNTLARLSNRVRLQTNVSKTVGML